MGREGVGRATCPVVVGRDGELAALRRVFDAAATGRGATLVLQGEAGLGKTRLLREVVAEARARPMTVLVGRGSEHGRAPYRPLVEAFAPVGRSGARPELGPFGHALGAVVPDWRVDGGGEATPAVVAEGIVRLCRTLGSDDGAALVLDDLQWSDPETLGVVDYLAETIADERLAIVMGLRTGEGPEAASLVTGLERRGAADVVTLARLDRAGVAAMVRACRDGDADDDLVDVVARRSEGLPLVVEELLAVPGPSVAVAVPASFGESVLRRMDELDADAASVVRGAALLGHRFDWTLLPEIAALGETQVGRALERAVEADLLEPDGQGFRFRHPLTRDAVQAATLPSTRAELARRAAAALDGDDDRVLTAADLWLEAGEQAIAVKRLVDAGRRALDRGALVTADRLLDRARTVPTDDIELRAAATELLAEVLSLAAQGERTALVATEALDLLESVGAPGERKARVHLALGRAAQAAGRWADADRHAADARGLAAGSGDAHLAAMIDLLAAQIAMAEMRFDEAAQLAAVAAGTAASNDLPDLECEAYELLGRRARVRDLAQAAEDFQRAYRIATEHQLALPTVRALHELGTIDMLVDGSPGRLQRAGELAYDAGALALGATIDLQLVSLHAIRFDVESAERAAERALEVAGPLRLDEVAAFTRIQRASAYGAIGDRVRMEADVEAALALAGDRPLAQATAWGQARAMCSLLEEDRSRALEELGEALAWCRQASGVTGPFASLSALVRVIEGHGVEAIDEVRGLAAQAIPVSRAILSCAEAVLAGRSGDGAAAAATFVAADARMRATGNEPLRQLTRRLVSEAALADGWGEPAAWLSTSLAFFQAAGNDRVAGACRDLLRVGGYKVPRSVPPGLPEELRAVGVTAREAEVLALVGEQLSNQEIADRLYLSRRTVEKHVERLLQKTGAATRQELAGLAGSSVRPSR